MPTTTMWTLLAGSVFLAYVLICLLTYWYLRSYQRTFGWKLLRDCRRVLVIVAHPDDECLFFGPTLRNLCSGSNSKEGDNELSDVHVLCMSSGDYRKNGAERKHEFRRSCQRLGIPDSNVTLIEHTNLPDNPRAVWKRSLVNEIILRHVEQLDIDTVVSFDRYGVSGHANHGAIFGALQLLYSKGLLPVDTRVFVLESVSIWRKYAGLLDVPWSCWRSNYCYINDTHQFVDCITAMGEHKSQLTWFRYLYMCFSRYMIVNTLKRISPTETQFVRRSTQNNTSISKSSLMNARDSAKNTVRARRNSGNSVNHQTNKSKLSAEN